MAITTMGCELITRERDRLGELDRLNDSELTCTIHRDASLADLVHTGAQLAAFIDRRVNENPALWRLSVEELHAMLAAEAIPDLVFAPPDDPYRCPECGAQRDSPTAACDRCTYVPEAP